MVLMTAVLSRKQKGTKLNMVIKQKEYRLEFILCVSWFDHKHWKDILCVFFTQILIICLKVSSFFIAEVCEDAESN